MIISELIKELEEQKELHGDIEVEIFATTDCGYSGGGGEIEDITYETGQKEVYDDELKKWNLIHYPTISLNNYQG